jgi:hypothetical protein
MSSSQRLKLYTCFLPDLQAINIVSYPPLSIFDEDVTALMPIRID